LKSARMYSRFAYLNMTFKLQNALKNRGSNFKPAASAVFRPRRRVLKIIRGLKKSDHGFQFRQQILDDVEAALPKILIQGTQAAFGQNGFRRG